MQQQMSLAQALRCTAIWARVSSACLCWESGRMARALIALSASSLARMRSTPAHRCGRDPENLVEMFHAIAVLDGITHQLALFG